MSTHVHRLIPLDPYVVPGATDIQAAVAWLHTQIKAYRIEAVTPGHVTFFDCGGGLDTVLCPNCHTDVGDPLWKDWMDDSYIDGAGFTLTKRTLACCGSEIGLDALKFDAHCAFGSFGIDITDTMTTLGESELKAQMDHVATILACPLQRVDARY
jgi:hypothetical protein